MGSHYKPSPQGEAIHPWINKPDTKYNAEGLFHVDLAVSGQEGQDMMEEVRLESDAAFERIVAEKELKPAEAKKWSTYYPYTVEEDEEGKPTGRVIFKFKQNAKIRQPDGAMKKFIMGIRDSADKALKDVNIFPGAILRAMWKARAVTMSGTKQIGVRLDFSMVQVIAQADNRRGFGAVEGGFTQGEPDTNDAGSEDADY